MSRRSNAGSHTMACCRYPTLMAILLMGWTSPARAQQPPLPDKKQDEAIQRVQRLLDQQIETVGLHEEQPLRSFLEAVEKRLPKDARVALRIDSEAFGDQAPDVRATPIALPAVPKKMSLRTALRLALAQCKVPSDYRIGAAEVVVTTPERAQDTVVYDIRHLVEKRGAARIVKAIC